MVKLSKKSYKKIRTVLVVLIVTLMVSWSAIMGLQVWLDSAILENNYSSMVVDRSAGNLKEVSDVYANGDFIVEGSSKLLTAEKVITDYVRVPKYSKYYYGEKEKVFFAPLTEVESRDILLKFVFLDLVGTILLGAVLIRNRSKEVWKKVLSWVTVIAYVIWTTFVYAEAFEVLYRVRENVWIIGVGKVIVICLALLVAYLIDARRVIKQPRRLS